ncbi:MAG: hypothetical protein QXU40_01795 [Candidatus Pacearchaeota archaeon]
MAEKDTIFSSKIKYDGFFSFKDFYKFCYDWIKDEMGFDALSESKYEEKVKGEEKEIKVEWGGKKDMTDYFRFEIKVDIRVSRMREVEIVKEGVKLKMNTGSVELGAKGILVRDYKGKFEGTALKKFLRGIYEKWVIPSRISEYEGKISGGCDEFLAQAKAYLDLEGKR